MSRTMLIALTCLGCASLLPQTTPPMKNYVPFSEADVAWAARAGTGSITGEAFLKTRGGDVKTAAGNAVVLMPVSAYTTEIYRFTAIEGRTMEASDPRLAQYVRSVVAGVNGAFEFTALPPGDYYLMSEVKWQVPGAYGLQTTGGNVYAKVSLAQGQTLRVILTH